MSFPKPLLCKCGHDLQSHPPDPAHPFAWPCKDCDCTEFDAPAIRAEPS